MKNLPEKAKKSILNNNNIPKRVFIVHRVLLVSHTCNICYSYMSDVSQIFQQNKNTLRIEHRILDITLNTMIKFSGHPN